MALHPLRRTVCPVARFAPFDKCAHCYHATPHTRSKTCECKMLIKATNQRLGRGEMDTILDCPDCITLTREENGT